MLTIRELRRDDNIDAVFHLCKEFFRDYEQHHDEFFDIENLTDENISGRILESIDSPTSVTIIALTDNKIVGYASLTIGRQPDFYKIKKVGRISALMIDPEYRRRGIAGQILKESATYFRNKGIKYFTFYTSVNNQPAINLYKKLGLKELHLSFLGETGITE